MPASVEVEAEEKVQPARSGGLLFGAMLFFGGRLAGALAAFALHWVLARWLGASEQGRCAEALSWVILLSTLVLVGLPQAAVRFLPAARAAGHDDVIHGFVTFSWRFVLGLGLAVAIAGGLGAAIFAPRAEWALIFATLASVPVVALLRQGGGLAHGMSWLGIAAFPHNFVRPTLLLVVVVLAWRFGASMTASAVVLSQIAVVLPILAWQEFVLRRRFKPHMATAQRRDVRTWLSMSVPVMLVTLYTGFFPEFNVAIMGMLVGDSQLGVFFIGFRVAWLLAFVVFAVDHAVMPAVSRLHAAHDLDAVARELARASRLKLLGVGLAAVLLAVFGEQVLAAFGEEEGYTAAYWPMLILVGAQLGRSAIGPAFELLSITGHHGAALRVTVIGLTLTLIAQCIVVPVWGLVGAATVVMVVVVVTNLAMRWVCLEAVGVDPSILGLVKRR